MKSTHLATLVAAWLRPKSFWPLVVVFFYCQYFLVVDREQLTLNIFLAWLVATASPGVWLGHCARDARLWPAATFVPAYTRMLAGVVGIGAGAALALGVCVAWAGGLALWTAAAFGTLAIAAALLAGFCFGYRTLAMLGAASWASIFVMRDVSAAFAPGLAQPPFSPGWAAWLGVCLFAGFIHSIHRPLTDKPWAFADQLRRFRHYGAWLPSAVAAPPPWRIVGAFGVAAIAVATVARYGPVNLHGLEWIVLAGMLVQATFIDQPSAFPHGKLAAASNLLLLGVGKTRTNAARWILWRVMVDSFLGTVTFTAVAVAFGATIRVFEVFSALAACHLYLTGACGAKWLLSGYSGALVAMPSVVLLAWLGRELLVTSLPAAVAAFAVSAAIAIYWGGRRMGRLDFE